MLNKEIYLNEPTPTSILNEGVVDVVAGKNEVLKYELKTFVCEGKYEEGMKLVLSNFLTNFGKETMPTVWVGGFYGSGKSHLVKMLAQIWQNAPLPDGTRPRDIVTLPNDVKELLVELNTLGKQNGGLHAATGTLHGEDTDDMKMAILKTAFRSVGLPETYAQAKFVLWLRGEGKEDEVRANVEAQGGAWSKELLNLNVSKKIHKALCEIIPETFPSQQDCAKTLRETYPRKESVSDTDFKVALFDALAKNGKMPPTLIVMDEVQQYIGNNDDRVASVQSAVQACGKATDGRILLVCTGQSALNGTTMLQKIKDRFTVEIQLQDMDITSVIRSVVLRKKPECKSQIEKVLTDNIGEISKHLAGTPFAYRPDVDKDCLAADYPILPSRRRFWEKVLLALDVNGTDGQLRNLLKMNRDFAVENGGEPLGHVVEADKLFFSVATRLLNNGSMSQEFYDDVLGMLKEKDPDKRLAARACGLVFLVNKLADHNPTIGLKATAEVLADLMVGDLHEGSAGLRKNLPAILEKCPALQLLGDTYRVQTKESAEWSQQFKAEVGALKSSGSAEVDTARLQRVNAAWVALGIKDTVMQGKSKTPRDVKFCINKDIPASDKGELVLCVANDWFKSQKAVRDTASAAGMDSAHVWVYVPKSGGDKLRDLLIESLAAQKTIEKRPTPSTPEGVEAKGAIETKRQMAESQINQLIAEMFAKAVVYQGGGTEVTDGTTLAERIKSAETVAANRLYSQFGPSDDANWAAVWTAAHKGSPDSLSNIGHTGETKAHPIAQKILTSLGTGKKGDEIRKALMAAPYGWTKDAIDGTLGALLVSGEIVARGADGKLIDPKKIERKQMGLVEFRIEAPVLLVTQQIKLCGFFQSVLGEKVNKEELPFRASAVLDEMKEKAASAGGAGPLPEAPDTAFIDNLRALSGNELLVKMHENIDDYKKKLADWKIIADKIAARSPAWQELEKLAVHVATVPSAKSLCDQVGAIRLGRQLLDNPDPVPPVSKGIADILRKELESRKAAYKAAIDAGEARLAADANWGKLTPEQRGVIRKSSGFVEGSLELAFKTERTIDILNAFATYTLEALDDKIAAVKPKYDTMLAAAAKELEPKLQYFSYPSETLKTAEEVDAWIAKVSAKMKEMLANGPIRT